MAIILADLLKDIGGTIKIGDIFFRQEGMLERGGRADTLHSIEMCVTCFRIVGIFQEEQLHSQVTANEETLEWTEVYTLYACSAISWCPYTASAHFEGELTGPHLSLQSNTSYIKWNKPDFYTYEAWIEKNFDTFERPGMVKLSTQSIINPAIPINLANPMEMLEL